MSRFNRRFSWAFLVVVLALSTRLEAGQPLTTQLVASGLSSPVMVKSPPGDTQRLMIVQRGGRVRLVKNGVLQTTDFIDLTGQVLVNDERGLLDIAFHPNYASNGWFYLRYTNTSGQTQIKRFTRSANPDVAEATSGYSIFRLGSTISFHIGGSMEFGRDGYLYVGIGDEVNVNWPQDINSLHGKLLRIDVSADDFPADADNNYRNPPTNPYFGAVTGRDEIWAKGLRNPYRFAFDRWTGALWIGDVANGGPEEIDFQPLGLAGRNYGWPCKEGSVCNAGNTQCNCGQSDLVAPVFEFTHDLGNCAVTGGRVYRGCAVPDLIGTYFFADYCSARIWSFRYDNNVMTEFNANRAVELDPPNGIITSIVGFGEDARGELYICELGGEVWKIVPSSAPPDLNGNGVPDSCEFKSGDVNRNGVVNTDDLIQVITTWGTCVGCLSDIAPAGGNGTVNTDDLLLVIGGWG